MFVVCIGIALYSIFVFLNERIEYYAISLLCFLKCMIHVYRVYAQVILLFLLFKFEIEKTAFAYFYFIWEQMGKDAINADQYFNHFCLSAMKIKDSMLY